MLRVCENWRKNRPCWRAPTLRSAQCANSGRLPTAVVSILIYIVYTVFALAIGRRYLGRCAAFRLRLLCISIYIDGSCARSAHSRTAPFPTPSPQTQVHQHARQSFVDERWPLSAWHRRCGGRPRKTLLNAIAQRQGAVLRRHLTIRSDSNRPGRQRKFYSRLSTTSCASTGSAFSEQKWVNNFERQRGFYFASPKYGRRPLRYDHYAHASDWRRR